MNDLQPKTMTIKELADSLEISVALITKRVKEIFPLKMEKGKTTRLNEYEVTAISSRIKENSSLISPCDPSMSMTVLEVSNILGVDSSTVRKKVKDIYPILVSNGKTTFLNETQVTVIKRAIFDQNPNLGRVSEVKTDLEKELLIQQAMTFQAEKVQSLQIQLQNKTEENKRLLPKAEFYDQVTGSKDAIDIGSVAKVLNIKLIGRNKLFSILRGKGILQEDNQPYQEYIDRGYFRTIEQSYTTPDGTTHINIKTVVYQRGVDYIRKMVQPVKVISSPEKVKS